jgi:acetyltransferase-like isoleucine patch superfamily enzyme
MVLNDIPNNSVVAGNPAKIINRNDWFLNCVMVYNISFGTILSLKFFEGA